jgi:hypothetical protein
VTPAWEANPRRCSHRGRYHTDRQPGERLLVLDPDPADPKWILATVAAPGDVRPADPGATVDEVTAAWVASVAGLSRLSLTPLPGALAWRVDERGGPR